MKALFIAVALLGLSWGAINAAQGGERPSILVQKNFLYVGEEQALEFSVKDSAGRPVPLESNHQTVVFLYGPNGLAGEERLTLRPSGDIQMRFAINQPGKWKAVISSQDFGLAESQTWEVRPKPGN